MGLHRAYIGLHRAYIGSKSGKKYISGLNLLAFVSTSLNKRALSYVFPWDVCLSGVFRVCEVADKNTIKHDKPQNINEYSRCTPGKIPKDLRSLAFSSRYYPIYPYNRFTPDIPKINKHVCSFRAVCRCWPNIGPSLPMSEDVPGKSNVVYRCTLAICGCTYETCRFSHRAPQSGQCKPGFSNAILVFDFPVHYDVLYFRRTSIIMYFTLEGFLTITINSNTCFVILRTWRENIYA